MSETIKEMYNSFLGLFDQVGSRLETVANTLSGKSDDPSTYMPYKHVRLVELMLTKDPTLAISIAKMGARIKENVGNSSRQAELTDIYVQTLKQDGVL